ncbi:Alpha/beta hydrolase fold-1 - like 10 [Theobroma cacao]|nr:Alpha/beta hydrolase fold-1 - like 10 [Theobroma cacao]
MAGTLLLSPQPLTLPNFSVSTKKPLINSQRATKLVTRASATEKNDDKSNDDKGFIPFGFVTDNPSSRSAIQLPETPAQDGNVGQMLYRIEDKGKEYGSYIKSGKFRWFVRETGSPQSRRGTVVFLHGAPTQSYSYRVVMSQMSDAGFHCFAPDWIGFGFSDKPQPGYGFDYTEKEFHEELDKLLDVLGVKSPFFLVVQGFLVGSYGLTWALKNPSKISKLAILNTPLTVSSPIPGLFQKLRIPLFGEFTSQNAVMAERFIEAGSPYVSKVYLRAKGISAKMSLEMRKYNAANLGNHTAINYKHGSFQHDLTTQAHFDHLLPLAATSICSLDYFYGTRTWFFTFLLTNLRMTFDSYVLKLEKADVYRLPYLSSSGPALLEAARKINFRDISSQIADGFASGRWDKTILIAWGIADKYLPQSVAEEFQKGNPNSVELELIEGAGHMPQEDWFLTGRKRSRTILLLARKQTLCTAFLG